MMPRHSRDIFDHMFKVPISFNSLFEQHERQLATLQKSVPSYDISNSDDKMELSFDLPGVRLDDIVVELKNGGKLLKISGSRKYSRNGTVFKSDFEESFTIDDRTLDVNDISASLSDGVLVISAPKLKQNLPMVEKRIPIHISSGTADTIQSGHNEVENEQNKEIPLTESEGIEISEDEEIEIEKE
jgi:HSP20 family molecular chaperone IbpA